MADTWPALSEVAAVRSRAQLSYLNVLQELGNEMLRTEQDYARQGDTTSAASMASMGMALGERLRRGAGPIDELVGIATEKKILTQLDPAGTYDFLGRPVSQALADLDEQKQAIKDAIQLRDEVRPTLSESELSDYWEREKIYGEAYALQSQHRQP
jgi:hypothetical protein